MTAEQSVLEIQAALDAIKGAQTLKALAAAQEAYGVAVNITNMRKLLALIQSQKYEIGRLTDELRFIANADVVSWDDPSEFRAWAQNRARAALTTQPKEQS